MVMSKFAKQSVGAKLPLAPSPFPGSNAYALTNLKSGFQTYQKQRAERHIHF